jgi:hypothetical protein
LRQSKAFENLQRIPFLGGVFFRPERTAGAAANFAVLGESTVTNRVLPRSWAMLERHLVRRLLDFLQEMSSEPYTQAIVSRRKLKPN